MRDVRHAKIAAWWDRAVDIIPASGGKGIGVQKILEHFHLSPDEAAAFGDGDNDIEMLQAVGTGIAMANASANLKQAADVLCKHPLPLHSSPCLCTGASEKRSRGIVSLHRQITLTKKSSPNFLPGTKSRTGEDIRIIDQVFSNT